MAEDTWITRPDLAARWKMPIATLNQWGSQGRGPKYAKFGKHCRYKLSDVIAWENAQFGDGGEAPGPFEDDDTQPDDYARLAATPSDTPSGAA
jgi:hypothetical protein